MDIVSELDLTDWETQDWVKTYKKELTELQLALGLYHLKYCQQVIRDKDAFSPTTVFGPPARKMSAIEAAKCNERQWDRIILASINQVWLETFVQ
jgi:hypothetical protein